MTEQAMRFRLGIFVLAALVLLAVLVMLFGGLANVLAEMRDELGVDRPGFDDANPHPLGDQLLAK